MIYYQTLYHAKHNAVVYDCIYSMFDWKKRYFMTCHSLTNIFALLYALYAPLSDENKIIFLMNHDIPLKR